MNRRTFLSATGASVAALGTRRLWAQSSMTVDQYWRLSIASLEKVLTHSIPAGYSLDEQGMEYEIWSTAIPEDMRGLLVSDAQAELHFGGQKSPALRLTTDGWYMVPYTILENGVNQWRAAYNDVYAADVESREGMMAKIDTKYFLIHGGQKHVLEEIACYGKNGVGIIRAASGLIPAPLYLNGKTVVEGEEIVLSGMVNSESVYLEGLVGNENVEMGISTDGGEIELHNIQQFGTTISGFSALAGCVIHDTEENVFGVAYGVDDHGKIIGVKTSLIRSMISECATIFRKRVEQNGTLVGSVGSVDIEIEYQPVPSPQPSV